MDIDKPSRAPGPVPDFAGVAFRLSPRVMRKSFRRCAEAMPAGTTGLTMASVPALCHRRPSSRLPGRPLVSAAPAVSPAISGKSNTYSDCISPGIFSDVHRPASNKQACHRTAIQPDDHDYSSDGATLPQAFAGISLTGWLKTSEAYRGGEHSACWAYCAAGNGICYRIGCC